jgi:predicted MFS family arabinose efflux permease
MTKVSPLQSLKNIASDSNQLLALAFMSAIMLAQFCIVPFISPYLVHNVKYPEHYLSLMYSLGGAFTIFTSPMFGRISDRVGKPRVFTMLTLLSMIPVFLITNMPVLPMGAVLVITTSFFIIVGGRGAPAMAMITSAAPARSRGSFMGINTAVQHFSTSIAIVTAGMIVSKKADGSYVNYNIVGFMCMAILLICIFLAWRVKPAKDPTAPKH